MRRENGLTTSKSNCFDMYGPFRLTFSDCNKSEGPHDGNSPFQAACTVTRCDDGLACKLEGAHTVRISRNDGNLPVIQPLTVRTMP
jgi:hypothetical protein